MPVPDKHAGEPTKEISRDRAKLYREAKAQAEAWLKEANRLKAELIAELGDAYAGTIDGEKVVTYRPKRTYALSRLREDYPDLTERYMRWKTEMVFDVDAFGLTHHDILDKYRVRELRDVES